jgi:simple sugar transport system permease protein
VVSLITEKIKPSGQKSVLTKFKNWLRELPTIFAKIVVYIISVGFALLFFSLIVIAIGCDPLIAFKTLFSSSIGSLPRLIETLVITTPLIFTGVAVAIAFKINFWNLGVEGQLFWGAIALTYVGIFVTGVPPPIQFLLGFVLAFLMGGLWALIPGALKAYLRVNEIIVSIMLNFVTFLVVDYLASGPWHDPMGFEPLTYPVSESVTLPRLVLGTRFHIGLFIAILFAFLIYIILNKSRLGFEIKVVGDNAEAAKGCGINIARAVVLTSILSGGIAGLCGASEIAGVHHRLLRGISPGYGFTGIIIALLAKNHPIWVIPVAFFFAILLSGSNALQRTIMMPAGAVYAIQAIVALCILIPEYVLRR